MNEVSPTFKPDSGSYLIIYFIIFELWMFYVCIRTLYFVKDSHRQGHFYVFLKDIVCWAHRITQY